MRHASMPFFRTLVFSAFFALMSTGCFAAEVYPDKVISLIVPFEAGAGVDTIARVVGKYAPKYLGQNIVIINKPGAGGQSGWNALMREPADGYTIAVTVIPNIVFQPLLRDAKSSGYTFADFAHLATLCVIPTALAVGKDSPYTTLEAFLQAAKAKKRGITLGIPAVRSDPHALALMLARQQGLEFNIIPESGGAAMLKGLMGGHIDAVMSNLVFLTQNTDNMRLLAISAAQRSPLNPDVPTFKESGVDIVSVLTRGFAVRQGTPEPVLRHLRDGFAQLAQDPDFLKDMKTISSEVTYLDAEATRIMGEKLMKQPWLIEAFKK